jgi:hypothetical protein
VPCLIYDGRSWKGAHPGYGRAVLATGKTNEIGAMLFRIRSTVTCRSSFKLRRTQFLPERPERPAGGRGRGAGAAGEAGGAITAESTALEPPCRDPCLSQAPANGARGLFLHPHLHPSTHPRQKVESLQAPRRRLSLSTDHHLSRPHHQLTTPSKPASIAGPRFLYSRCALLRPRPCTRRRRGRLVFVYPVGVCFRLSVSRRSRAELW